MLSAFLSQRTLRPILCVRDVCNVCGNKKSRPYSERFVFYVKHFMKFYRADSFRLEAVRRRYGYRPFR